MAAEIRTYLVGRRNSSVPCDIALPENETSVSRKHLELTVTASGHCYIVHVHPQNTTKVQGRDGAWLPISQDYVEYDTPLMLGTHQTTARHLLALLQQPGPPAPASPPPLAGGGPLEWDPERGTFLKR
jgi:hypothetical protein